MAEMILLRVERVRSDWPDDWPLPLPITGAQREWRARRGYLIHRPLRGMIYLHGEGHTHMTWLCGNGSNDPIPVRPECMEGLKPCRRCGALVEQPPTEKGD